MPLQFLPIGARRLAADPKHPYFDKSLLELSKRHELIVFLNGEPVTSTTPVLVIDCDNGYITVQRHDSRGNLLYRQSKNKALNGKPQLARLKGKVEMFVRTEGKDEA